MRRYWHPLPTVSLYPLLSLIPASYFPLWIHPRTLHLQLWMEPITRFLSHISQGHEKASAPPPASPLRTPPCSAMKWHPYLINCESWNFAQETPFLCTWQWLNCTAMQFHSPRRWEEKGAGEGLCTVLLVCVCVCVCVFERWRWFPCDIMGPRSMAPQQRVPSVHRGHVVGQHSGILQLIYRGAKEVCVCVCVWVCVYVCVCVCVYVCECVCVWIALHTNVLQRP